MEGFRSFCRLSKVPFQIISMIILHGFWIIAEMFTEFHGLVLKSNKREGHTNAIQPKPFLVFAQEVIVDPALPFYLC